MTDFPIANRRAADSSGCGATTHAHPAEKQAMGMALSRRGVLRGAAVLAGTAAIAPYTTTIAGAAPAEPVSAAVLETQLLGLDKPIYLLETTVPSTFSVSAGAMEISGAHAKVGRHSLRWDYRPGARLSVQNRLHLGTAEPTEVDHFAVWLYNETAVDGRLRLQFGRDSRVDAWKDVHLDFSGWRTVWLRYDRDLEGDPHQDMNRIWLVAPNESGTIWIDQLAPNVSVRPDRVTPDLQVPDVAPDLRNEPNFHWLGLHTYWQLQAEPGFDTGNVSSQEIDDAQKVYDRLLQRHQHERDYSAAALEALEQKFEKFGIPELADPNADGDALRPGSVGSFVYDKQLEVIPPDYRAAVIEISDGTKLRTLWDDLGLRTAQTWQTAHRDGDDAAARRSGQLVLRMMVHLLDQGWAAGSGQGTIHHLGYGIRSWVDALLLMEPLLRERGLWPRCSAALEWYVGTGRLTYDFDEQWHRSGLVDVLNTLLEGLLTTCFTADSWEEKVGRLRSFHSWIDHAHSYSPGLDGGYKVDGSIYHHNGPYTLYGRDGLTGSIPVLLDVAGTTFALSAAGQEVLTTALRHQMLLTNTLDYPLSLSGRHQNTRMNVRGLVNLHALLGRNPLDGSEGIDEYHASMFRRLVPADNPSSWMLKMDEQFAAEGIEEAAAPNGYWASPYGALGLSRQDEWQVSVRGHNRYIWSAEIYPLANRYGRYQTYGQITALTDTDDDAWSDIQGDNGITPSGYDWNFIPGTTTKTLPFDRLEVDLTGEIQSMVLTESRFGGAGVMAGHASLFGMEVKEHPDYDPTHTARISAFMVGDRVIALGSGVRNTDHENPTRTTLFQASPEVMAEPQDVRSGSGWVTDPAGNGYVVMAGPELTYGTGEQTTPNQDGRGEGSGVFALGYLDHGTAPHDSGYAYVLLVHGGEQRTAELAQQVQGHHGPIVIDQRNRVAHVVTDTESRVTAHTIFEPDTELVKGSIVRSTSRQALVLSRIVAKGRATAFSVTDPDLHLYRGRDEEQYDGDTYVGDESPYTRWWQHNESISTETEVVLRGRWRLENSEDGDQPAVNRVGGDTVVTITGQHGASVEFTLVRGGGEHDDDDDDREEDDREEDDERDDDDREEDDERDDEDRDDERDGEED
ncbi:hypothetical protein CFK38_06655 [Brachybacterium vulturis]|uniref:Uncharacterized protein n=1 Tax=Brachybacterium vulturis TaxID=2017484 RepID=A0A291GME8_9MICO|nr:chondroitinase family polysaccharide lyase [Brachybacterium vulturis]ATG51240.1 hypothetical protein CFK38_06655 [Brachybacterium vulturis]